MYSLSIYFLGQAKRNCDRVSCRTWSTITPADKLMDALENSLTFQCFCSIPKLQKSQTNNFFRDVYFINVKSLNGISIPKWSKLSSFTEPNSTKINWLTFRGNALKRADIGMSERTFKPLSNTNNTFIFDVVIVQGLPWT